MSYAIIALNLASLAGLAAATVLGYVVGAGMGAAGAGAEAAAATALAVAFRRHFTLGLVATLIGLFSESMVFFYFIGTGVSIKKAVALYRLDQRYLARVREFKVRTSGIAFLALLGLIAAFVLGGGVAARAVPAWAHQVAAWVAIAAHGASTVASARAITDNMGLLSELDRVVVGMAARGEVQIRRTVV